MAARDVVIDIAFVVGRNRDLAPLRSLRTKTGSKKRKCKKVLTVGNKRLKIQKISICSLEELKERRMEKPHKKNATYPDRTGDL